MIGLDYYTVFFGVSRVFFRAIIGMDFFGIALETLLVSLIIYVFGGERFKVGREGVRGVGSGGK